MLNGQLITVNKSLNSQSSDKIVGIASDHRPATWIHRVFVPVAESSMRIIQTFPYCSKRHNYIAHHQKKRKKI